MPHLLTRSGHRVALTVALTVFVVACKKEPPPSPPAAPPAAAPAPVSPVPDPIGLVPLPEDKAKTALLDYRISLPQIQRWGKAQSAITAVMAEHHEIVEEMQRTPPHTLDAMIAMLDGQPRIHGALKQSGMTATDFVLTMTATNEAVQGYRRKLSSNNTLPPDLPPALVANIAVVEQNLAAINQVYASLSKH